MFYRQDVYVDENRTTIMARTPVDGTDPAIVLGPVEYCVDFQIPVTVQQPNGQAVQVPVTVPVKLDGATLADAFADIPAGFELAKGRAMEIVHAQIAEAQKQAAKPGLILPGLNGHHPNSPASRLRLRSGEE